MTALENSRLFFPRSHPGSSQTSRRQDDARLAIKRVDRLDRAVTDDRSERWVEMSDEPLRLAERIGEENARATGGDVLAPPGVDRGERLSLRAPAIDRQAEGRFGDEGVTADRLEGRRNAVALELVVARGDPNLALRGDANLRGTQHMAGGMKRKLDPVARQDLAIRRRLDRDVAQALAQDRRRVAMADIDLRAEARVIGMRMGDDGARNRAPGIDVKIARGAIEPAVGGSDEVQGCVL